MPHAAIPHEQFTPENGDISPVEPYQGVVDDGQPTLAAMEGIGTAKSLHASVVAEVGHTMLSRSMELHSDPSHPNLYSRLPCLERKRFDPDQAHLKLELYSDHNIFVTSLENFDTSGSSDKYPLPAEFNVFSERRARIDALFSGVPSTAKADAESKKRGMALDALLFSDVNNFLEKNPRGKQIIADMGIVGVGLKDMSAKETIYIIGYLMHELTNYDRGAVRFKQGDAPADRMNSLAVVRNGIAAASKQDVRPLGVCRNYADVGEALFNAFKTRNPKLTNIYCNNAGGFAGATMGQLHKKGEDWKGHAWLDFIAVGPKGDMAITSVDPTWTTRSGRSLSRYDVTGLRIGTHTRNILATEKLNYTTRKIRNLDRISDYYAKQVGNKVGLLKKMFSNGQRLNLNTVDRDDPVLKSATYQAIDYIISAAAFGGSSFFVAENPVPKSVMTLVHYAAQDPNILFSPSEYDAVNVGLSAYERYVGMDDSGRARIAKTRNELSVRYAVYSKTDDYRTLFGVNEGL